MTVRPFFDQATFTVTYLVFDPETRDAVVIDPVLDYDQGGSQTSTRSVEALAIDCNCRKPAPGLLLQASSELGLALGESLLIGDKPSDIEAARAAGVGRAYLVASDNPESGANPVMADGHFASLLDCATQLFPAQPQENRT